MFVQDFILLGGYFWIIITSNEYDAHVSYNFDISYKNLIKFESELQACIVCNLL